MATSTRATYHTASFRYEADMIPLLRKALPRLTFRHETPSPVKVFTEVPAVHGVPDLTGVRFIDGHVQTRANAGIRPLSTDIEVRTVLALGESYLDIRELALRTNTSHKYLQGAVVPLLMELGWLGQDGNCLFRRPEAQWVARRVITVEAKLKNWRSALSQARRQRHSADGAYMALDAVTIPRVEPYLDQISRSGVGVISVDRNTERCHVLVRPSRSVTTSVIAGRYLLAERCLDMMQRGTFEGQVYPVFGQFPPSSSI